MNQETDKDLTLAYMVGFEKGKEQKQMTDQEIDEIAKNNDGVLRLFYMISGDITGLAFKEALRDFARAILRKAQEK